MGRKRKRTPQQIAASRKKAAGKSSGEERFDLDAELRRAYAQTRANKARVDGGHTFAAGARTGRQAAPSKTDGKNYW